MLGNSPFKLISARWVCNKCSGAAFFREAAFALLLCCLAFNSADLRAELRLVSWNLNNLHHSEGEALRRGAVRRTAEDYRIVRDLLTELNGDIYAFQEVGSPRALEKILPGGYAVYFSGRYRDGERGDIYQAFAVRKARFDRIAVRDVEALGLARLRWGLELNLRHGQRSLTLLNVHLKSGCSRGSLSGPKRLACRKLLRQAPLLRQWIIEAYRSASPFVVLGDFNRAFERFGDDDHLWQRLVQDSPAGLGLWRLPVGQKNLCWQDSPLHFEYGIDFFVFGPRAWQWVRGDSFRQHDFPAALRDVHNKLPSDHCPIAVDLAWPAA